MLIRSSALRSCKILEKVFFDVLVGINLLREGLDVPECHRVMILDADKEGFLRSKTSLVQTIGRAARNVNGKAILYADKVTDSMQYAIDETNRRREKQLAYNKEHNITPETVKKNLSEIVWQQDESRAQKFEDVPQDVFESSIGFAKHIESLKKKMLESAANLEFEEAASIRDEIKRLEDVDMGL